MIRLVKMTFKEEHIEDFKSLFESIKQKIIACEGCEHLELLKDNNRGVFFTYSKWQDDTFLEKYRTSELFTATWQKIKPWFADKPDAWSIDSPLIVEKI
ncbi:MAG: antibiotic biosynthesis monooxygenase [Chitinophagaceae bacterium]|nr:antibiotic biosynthesis monooxygenase [Chitinophagaceae bacterium]